LDIVATWADDDANMVNIWQCQPGGDYANLKGDMDIAIGAFDSGESWQAVAAGAYDARWAQSLTALRTNCASHARRGGRRIDVPPC
jgi:protocatechuate 3,4-dioxygenase beta subunit